jgi:hypothetical protein
MQSILFSFYSSKQKEKRKNRERKKVKIKKKRKKEGNKRLLRERKTVNSNENCK